MERLTGVAGNTRMIRRVFEVGTPSPNSRTVAAARAVIVAFCFPCSTILTCGEPTGSTCLCRLRDLGGGVMISAGGSWPARGLQLAPFPGGLRQVHIWKMLWTSKWWWV
jgi:hypothetical protein